MTQAELADRLGISRVTLTNWEIGRANPDHETLVRIADLFGVTTDYLLGRDAPLPPGTRTEIVMDDGTTLSLDDLPPEQREFFKEMLAFAASKYRRMKPTEGQ